MTRLVPEGLAATMRGRPGDHLDPPAARISGDDWLRALPALVAGLITEWGLAVDGPARHGHCALALPVASEVGPAVLKVTWPHREAATEHLALRRWDGVGAVRLLRADPSRWALLLERLDPDRDLHSIPDDEACEQVGALLRRLHVAPLAQVAGLAAYLDHQHEKATRAMSEGRVPRRFLDQARHLARELLADPGDSRLLHTDLHYANVLHGPRGWLAIDPKPHTGDPASEVAPLLWNRTDELGSGSQTRWVLRRRCEIVCEAAGLDQQRVRAWAIIRAVDNALDASADLDHLGLMVQICKAMHD